MSHVTGIELVNIEKYSEYKDKSSTFLTKIFAENELDYCFKKSNLYLALLGWYAVKEEVIKVLSNKKPFYNNSRIEAISFINNELLSIHEGDNLC